MPRTLLLALIVTAVTACNKSDASPGAGNAPDNVSKLPTAGGGEGIPDKVTETDSALAH